MIGSAPVFGTDSRFLLIGGFEVGPSALIRFYTLHVIGLPLVGAVLMAVHFWRIRKDGGEAGPPPPSRRELEHARAQQQPVTTQS
jgi:quinol-cytochrome oxidoreductase complex cytochrome b subunit